MLVSGISMPNPEMVWIFPKVIALMIFAVISILYIKSRLRWNLPTWLVLGYALTAITSGWLSGESLQYVLLGGEGRMDGLLYTLSLVIFFLVGYLLSRQFGAKVVWLYIGTVLFSSFLEGIIVILQRLGYDYVGALTIGMRYPLITGTIGNHGMTAALLLAAAVLATAVAVLGSNRFSIFSAWLAAAVYFSIVLGLLNNRASIYALLAVALAILLLNLRNYKAYFSLLIISLALLAVPGWVPNRTSLQTRSLTNTSTLSTRLAIWKITGQVIIGTKGQPFVGGGFDALKNGIIKQKLSSEYMNLYRMEASWPKSVEIRELRWLHEDGLPLKTSAIMVFANNDEGGKSYSGVYMVVLDKAHNLFLDRAVSTGLLSALVWLFLYLWPVAKALFSGNALLLTLAMAILALFFYYLFWFPVPQVEPIHVALLSIAWGLIYGSYGSRKGSTFA